MMAALASSAAAEIYDMEILRKDFQDQSHNTTRFLVLSKENKLPESHNNCLTTLVFKVKHMPAALYRALGVFAINNVNLLKIESYLEGGSFTAAAFYVDVEAHVESEGMQKYIKSPGTAGLTFDLADVQLPSGLTVVTEDGMWRSPTTVGAEVVNKDMDFEMAKALTAAVIANKEAFLTKTPPRWAEG